MDFFETKIFSNILPVKEKWFRCVDDVLCKWTDNENLDNFFPCSLRTYMFFCMSLFFEGTPVDELRRNSCVQKSSLPFSENIGSKLHSSVRE